MLLKTFHRAFLLFALLMLCNAAVNEATEAQFHHCAFDSVHRDAIESLPKATFLTTVESYNKMRTSVRPPKKYMRIKFSTESFKYSSKYCNDEDTFFIDMHHNVVNCKKKDFLTAEKKKELKQIVHSAIKMHTQRLKLRHVPFNIKVPNLRGPLCKILTVPKKHHTDCVAGTDMILYVSSIPSSNKNMFAAGAPCADSLTGRPIVGGLIYTTERIKFNVYSVRVATHEIAHALGFTHAIIRSEIWNNVKTTTLRYKKNVEEIRSPTVIQFVKKQYDCEKSIGVELEDEKGVLSVPSHSHWKRRNALEELMAPIVTTGYYTYLTLALFQDLGFYEADFDKAEEMEWGKGGGCCFLEYRCVGDGVDNSRYFCSDKETTKYRCAPGRRGLGKSSNIVQDDNVAYPYRYFWKYNWGGVYYQYYTGEESLMTDRCPIYESQEERSCTNLKGKAPGRRSEDSWCLRNVNAKAKKGFTNDICGRVAVTDNGDVYVNVRKNISVKCEKKQGYFYTAQVTLNGKEVQFECPTKQAVNQDKEMKNLIKSTGKNTEFDTELEA